MALIAIQYKLVPESPILVAANREERYNRLSNVPMIQSGKPRVLCGIDREANGTWLGVNQNGLFIGVGNRKKEMPVFISRSRGMLCLDMLRTETATEARDLCMEEIATGKYHGANFICADSQTGWAIHAGDDLNTVQLRDGLNIIADRDLNDAHDPRVELAQRLFTLQTLDSPVKFLAIASKVFARAPAEPDRPNCVTRGPERGTVSSTLISLGDKPRDAIYQYSAGSPDQHKYEDFSPLLRDILSRGLREMRSRANAT